MGIVSCMRHTDLGKVKIGYEIVFVGHYYFFCTCMQMPWCMCGGQKATCSNQLSPFVLRVPGIELRSSDLEASPFTL